MQYRTNYLEIHEKAYNRLLAEGKPAWSEAEDLKERVHFYLRTLAQEGIHPNASILVLGCGDGETSLALAENGYNVTGVDISPTAIHWAVEKAKNRNIGCKFIAQDLTSDINYSEIYDVIIDDHFMHCIIGNDRKNVLLFVSESLIPGGVFLMRTHCDDPPKNVSEEFKKTWDPSTRCQVHNGVAGRYFGLPKNILAEIESTNLTIQRSRVFQYPSGWSMLEVVAQKIKDEP